MSLKSAQPAAEEKEVAQVNKVDDVSSAFDTLFND